MCRIGVPVEIDFSKSTSFHGEFSFYPYLWRAECQPDALVLIFMKSEYDLNEITFFRNSNVHRIVDDIKTWAYASLWLCLEVF